MLQLLLYFSLSKMNMSASCLVLINGDERFVTTSSKSKDECTRKKSRIQFYFDSN